MLYVRDFAIVRRGLFRVPVIGDYICVLSFPSAIYFHRSILISHSYQRSCLFALLFSFNDILHSSILCSFIRLLVYTLRITSVCVAKCRVTFGSGY